MKKYLLGILSVIVAGIMVISPVFAEEKCVTTAILGGSACDKDGTFIHEIDKDHPLADGEFNCSCGDAKGSSILQILALIVDIMTIGIGILGVLGITIVGIQYLTAGGNEEKTRKAKRRMFEIVIGLVAYVLIFAILNWLLKDYQPLGS